MKEVAEVLARWAGADRLPELLRELEAAGAGNALWLEFMRRVRRSAGLSSGWSKVDEPKALLDLVDREKP